LRDPFGIAARRTAQVKAATEAGVKHGIEIAKETILGREFDAGPTVRQQRMLNSTRFITVDYEGRGEVSEDKRRSLVKQSRSQFVLDPLVWRAFLVYFSFVYHKGLSTPRLAADYEDALLEAGGIKLPSDRAERRRIKRELSGDKLPKTIARLNKIIAGFWTDSTVQGALSSYQAQKNSYMKFLRDGELPTLIYENGSDNFTAGILDSLEITAVESVPDKPGVPMLYKREFTADKNRMPVTEYYWSTAAYFLKEQERREFLSTKSVRQLKDLPQENVWLYMMRDGADPDSLRGLPRFTSALAWSRAVNNTASDLRTYLRARAAWAWREVTQGGAARVAAIKDAREYKLDRTQPAPPTGSIRVESKGQKLEPIEIGEGGSKAFETAINETKQMVYAGTGLPEHYFGNVSTGNLATSTAMELPTRMTMESEQMLMTSYYDGLFQTIVRMAGIQLDTQKLIEIDFPDIPTDISALSKALLDAKVAGHISQADGARYEALALGDDDVEGYVERALASEPQAMSEIVAGIENDPPELVQRWVPVVDRLSRALRNRLTNSNKGD